MNNGISLDVLRCVCSKSVKCAQGPAGLAAKEGMLLALCSKSFRQVLLLLG